MTTNIWTEFTGYDFGTYPENELLSIDLPVNTQLTNVTYTLISGNLPDGLSLVNNKIEGTPVKVPVSISSTFCIRALYNNEISDRTFYITISGNNPPEFLMDGDDLSVIRFTVTSASTGNTIKTTVTTGLVKDMRVVIDTNVGNGTIGGSASGIGIITNVTNDVSITIDTSVSLNTNTVIKAYTNLYNLNIGSSYQYYAFDNSFITHQIRAVSYNKSNNKKLYYYISGGELPPGLSMTDKGLITGFVNALTKNNIDNQTFNYVFTISITDDISIVSKKYAIYIVGPQYFTSDNDKLKIPNRLFTSDVMAIRPIQWETPSYLGQYKSDNFINLKLRTYPNLNYTYTYAIRGSSLPIGLAFDTTNCILSGYIPLHLAPITTYSFTVDVTSTNTITNEQLIATRTFTIDIISNVENKISWSNDTNGTQLEAEMGHDNEINLPLSTEVLNIIIKNGGFGFIEPPMIFIRPTNGGVNASAYCTINDGTIDSVVVTNPGSGYNAQPIVDVAINLGTIKTDFPVTLSISATNTQNTTIKYYLEYGELPPGLVLSDDGEIVGTVEKQQTSITFDGGFTLFDTVLSSKYMFTVRATDRKITSSRTFYLTIDDSSLHQYSNLYVKPFISQSKRSSWLDFINNPSIFNLDDIYRIYDKEYGIKNELSMLIFAGIETSLLDNYAPIVSLNHKKKRFLYGNIKKAYGIDLTTNTVLYEVVYIEMIDQNEPSVPAISEFTFNGTTYYPNNISNWRNNILMVSESIGLSTNQEFLPLWMRCIQPDTKKILGFTLAVPICYCKVGTGDKLITRINNHIKTTDFSLNQFDFTIDRYIIDSVSNYSGNKYIIFKN